MWQMLELSMQAVLYSDGEPILEKQKMNDWKEHFLHSTSLYKRVNKITNIVKHSSALI